MVTNAKRRWVALVMVVVVSSVLIGAVYLLGRSPGRPVGSKEFVIVAGPNGFNGSVQHGIPWPIIVVHKGDNVTITVMNDDVVETHGFAIVTYFEKGFTVRPGVSQSISFLANRTGNFTFYCNIICTVHQVMVGRLVVED